MQVGKVTDASFAKVSDTEFRRRLSSRLAGREGAFEASDEWRSGHRERGLKDARYPGGRAMPMLPVATATCLQASAAFGTSYH